jgi:hypothetical protein
MVRKLLYISDMKFIGPINPNTFAAVFLASILVFSTVAPAQTPNRQTAILVEADADPTCAGLDCPPWHVVPDFDVCLKADQKFYFGSYHTWKGPWAKDVNLHHLEGQQVEIEVGDKHIRIVSPQLDINVKRIYGAGTRFRIQSCKDAHAS